MKRVSIWIHTHPVLFWAILVAGIALLLRAALWFNYPPVPYSDTSSYRSLADVILSAAKNLSVLNTYDGTRTPGYPAFMALMGSDRAVYAAQLALGFLITMGFFYIGWQVTHKPELGALLGLVHTLNLGQLFFEADLITETVTTFWLFLSLLAAFIWLYFPGRRRFIWLVIMGVATGLATLTRPVYLFMPFWLALWLGVSWSKKRLHIDWRPWVGILAPAMLIIGGWIGENYAAHRILGLSTMTGYHLIEHTSYFFEYVPDEYAPLRDTFIRYRDAKIARVGNPGNVIFEAIPEMMKVSGLTFYDLSILLEKISFDLIIRHPDLYLKTVLSGWWYFWRAPVYWKPALFAWQGLAAGLKGVIFIERLGLVGSNLIFMVTTFLALCSKKLRQVWQVNAFFWILASSVWVASIMQTLPDHGDNPRFLVPQQTWVVFWVLWLLYQTIIWIKQHPCRVPQRQRLDGVIKKMTRAALFFSKQWVRWLACLLVSLILGAALAAGFGQGNFISGWSGTAFMLFFSLGLMLLAWQWARGDRQLAWMVVLAFVLRLGLGLFLAWALPRFAYDTPVDKAGYVFADAYTRDRQAWVLASSNTSLGAAFKQEFISDQYGGLLALSAAVYRVFSPDLHRPYLIIILSAAAAALGLPFLWVVLRRRWGNRVAGLACWIMALYPESVLLGSSQMREPFLISLVAVAFCIVLAWNSSPRKPALAVGFIASMAGMALFSSRTALPALTICALCFLLERTSQPRKGVWRWVEWLALALGGVVVIALSWEWLHSSVQWGVLQMIRNSGKMQGIVRGIPEILKSSLVIGYGLAQPVLPAAVIDPAALVWRVVGTLRALGWYTLAPLLVYALFVVWKAEQPTNRRLLIGLAVIVWVWILISSARGGGNQWDNPRYRTIFLVWMALLAAWTWNWVREHHDVWFWRLVGVELVFLGFLFAWYVARYYRLFAIIPFWIMIGLISLCGLIILAGGWFWDRFIKIKKIKTPFHR